MHFLFVFLLLLFVCCSIHFFFFLLFIYLIVSKRFSCVYHVWCVCVCFELCANIRNCNNYNCYVNTCYHLKLPFTYQVISFIFFLRLGFLCLCCWFAACCCSYCCYFCCHYYHTIAQIAFYDICIVTSISDFIYMDMISHIYTFLKSGVKRKEKNMKYFAEKD